MGRSLAGDMVRIWRRPEAVFRARLAVAGEGSALGAIMAACLIIFVSQWPRLARESHLAADLAGGEVPALRTLVAINLVAMLLVAPLVLLGVATLSVHGAALFGRRLSPLAARMALGWALLAVAPLTLIHGIVSGLAGPGPLVAATGSVVLLTFLWHWQRLMRLGAGA